MTETRNDISTLVTAGIPVQLGKFDCGCWGKHQPPYIEDGTIIVETGQGYRSNAHLHGQNLYTVEVGEGIALIEMRKYGDLYGAGMWHYLVGVDEAPFIAQIPSTIGTLADALDYLQPAEVKQARATGTIVHRQGDWFFVPVARDPRGDSEPDVALAGTDHVAVEAIVRKTVLYVRGTIRHGEHQALLLGCWHKAIRNKAIRTGRLARVGSTD